MRRKLLMILTFWFILSLSLFTLPTSTLGSEFATGFYLFPGSSNPLSAQVGVRLIKPMVNFEDLNLLMLLELGINTRMTPNKWAERDFFLAANFRQESPPFFWGSGIGLTFRQSMWRTCSLGICSTDHDDRSWIWLDLIGGVKIAILGHSLWAQSQVVLVKLGAGKGPQLPLEVSMGGGITVNMP